MADDGELIVEIDGLIDAYWGLAFIEGQEGRSVDTPAGDAQRVRSAITDRLRTLSARNAELERGEEKAVAWMVDRDGYLMLPLLRDRHEMMVYARNNPEEKLAPLYLHPSPPIPDSSSGEAGDDNRVDHERVRELARGNTRATAHEGYDMARELLFLRSRPAPPPESEGEAKGRWKCTECWCHSFTRIDKQHQPSGNFVPSDDVRCDNCKAVSRYPATLPANHKLVPVEATDLAAAQTDTEPHFAEALARDRPSLYTRLDPDAVRICPRRDGPCPHGVSCTYWQIDMDCSTEPRAALPPAKGDGV